MINKVFRVSPLGDSLEIVIELSNTQNSFGYYIEKIAIQSHDNFTEGYPEFPEVELEPNAIGDLQITNNRKVTKRLLFKDISLRKTDFYFLYIKINKYTGGLGAESVVILPTAFFNSVYSLVIGNIKAVLDEDCSVDTSYISDIYLKMGIFNQALELEDYFTAIELWDNILQNDIKSSNRNFFSFCDLNVVLNKISKVLLKMFTSESSSLYR